MGMERKPHVRLPQHKGREIDDVKRMEFAKKCASGERLINEFADAAAAIVDEKKRFNEAWKRARGIECKAPQTEEETDA